MKIILAILPILIFFCPVSLQAQLIQLRSQGRNINFPYLINSQSLNGYTGNILTPSPYTVPGKIFSFGLHRFNIGINYGLNNSWESGIFLNIKEYEHFTSTSMALHTKYHLIRQYEAGGPFDFSAGVNNDSPYFVFGRQFENFYDMVIESGIDLFSGGDRKLEYFFSVSKPTRFSCFILDYRSGTSQANFGWRVLLSPYVKLDLFFINLDHLTNAFDNFIFGLTLIG